MTPAKNFPSAHYREITPGGERLGLISPLIRLILIKRDLLRAISLVRLELKQQAYGLSLGRLWILLEPALMALTYYFLLTFVFRMQGSDATFANFLVAIIFWRSHSTIIINSATFLIGKGQQYLDSGFGLRMAFFEFILQEAILFLSRYIVLLVFLAVAGYTVKIGWLLALGVALCMFCFTTCLATWLSVLGVFFKDTAKLVGHFVWLWWYLSPGLYSFGRIPEWATPLFLLNPFSYILPASHSLLLGMPSSGKPYFACTLIAVGSIFLLTVGWNLMKRIGYLVPRYL